jgi:hypothetical protein
MEGSVQVEDGPWQRRSGAHAAWSGFGCDARSRVNDGRTEFLYLEDCKRPISRAIGQYAKPAIDACKATRARQLRRAEALPIATT